MYFQRLFTKGDFSSVCRPLFGYSRRNDERKTGICSLETLRRQLQLAIELEFFIIPVYLISMWSIIEGYIQSGNIPEDSLCCHSRDATRGSGSKNIASDWR